MSASSRARLGGEGPVVLARADAGRAGCQRRQRPISGRRKRADQIPCLAGARHPKRRCSVRLVGSEAGVNDRTCRHPRRLDDASSATTHSLAERRRCALARGRRASQRPSVHRQVVHRAQHAAPAVRGHCEAMVHLAHQREPVLHRAHHRDARRKRTPNPECRTRVSGFRPCRAPVARSGSRRWCGPSLPRSRQAPTNRGTSATDRYPEFLHASMTPSGPGLEHRSVTSRRRPTPGVRQARQGSRVRQAAQSRGSGC